MIHNQKKLKLEKYLFFFFMPRLVAEFQEFVLASFLGAFSIWLILDVFILFKDKNHSAKQMKLFALALNILALLSMIWILYSGNLLSSSLTKPPSS